jgi:hypothetical protein
VPRLRQEVFLSGCPLIERFPRGEVLPYADGTVGQFGTMGIVQGAKEVPLGKQPIRVRRLITCGARRVNRAVTGRRSANSPSLTPRRPVGSDRHPSVAAGGSLPSEAEWHFVAQRYQVTL